MYHCLQKAYREAFARKDVHNCNEALAIAVESPCPRYWISAKEAARQFARLDKGEPMTCKSITKKEIILCTYRNYLRLKEKRSFRNLPIKTLASLAVNQPAPKFFISVSYARKILHQLRYE